MTATHSPTKIVHENKIEGASGTMMTTIDWASGVIRLEGSGSWSAEQNREHLAEFLEGVLKLHQQGMSVVVIADLRNADIQPQDVVSLVNTQRETFYKPGDRIALVVSNSLVKLQLRRILGDQHEFFLSMTAAENWALAYKKFRNAPSI